MPILTAQEHSNNRALLEAVDVIAAGSMERVSHNDADTSWTFLEGEVDMALAPPLLYARRESDLVLMEGACVAATGATGELRLQFRQGLRDISTVGHYGDPGIDTMLTQIILKEKYGMHPRFLQMKRDPAEALASVDALLFPIGGEYEPEEDVALLDIVDEWFDMTQLPYVREVFVAWASRMDEEIDAIFRRAGEEVDYASLERIDEQLRGRGVERSTESLPAHYRYRFTEDAQLGLQEFFRLAFYHGLHRDIPNFTFWSPEEAEH